MKLRAARPRDLEDVRTLAGVLGLEGIDELVAVHDEVFADDPLPERTRRGSRCTSATELDPTSPRGELSPASATGWG